MHFYQFNIGDYIKHTSHLTPLEDITYRRLLDLYYDTEAPITQNNPAVSRRLRDPEEGVEIILNEFFTLTENGWVNARADAEIAAYHAFNEKQKANGIKGGRPKKTQNNPGLSQAEPKITLNRNQKPENNKQYKEPTPDGDVPQKPAKKPTSKKTPIPADFAISDSVRKWATEKGHTRLDEHFERFVGSCQAKGYLYADWDAALRNAITADWAKLATAQAKPVDSWAGRDF